MGKYDMLLSPMMVGGHLFKNRIVMTPTTPQHFQGDEDYPSENLFAHYLKRAKNGAAMITLSGLFNFSEDNPMPPEVAGHFKFDIFKGESHYLAQLEEALKFDTGDARLMIIGDNNKPASILELTREAYLAATSL